MAPERGEQETAGRSLRLCPDEETIDAPGGAPVRNRADAAGDAERGDEEGLEVVDNIPDSDSRSLPPKLHCLMVWQGITDM
ncbi:MAG: hypothetical protein XE11_2784 [Methanomicrobiales archaeon 53_19]|nr:MAG: hypothetical protein XE11_2784 [Methanomicrobiales archaeon 53_19]